MTGVRPITPGPAPTPQDWREIYDAALAYRESRPWTRVSDAEPFGVQDPESGAIGWCSVLGNAGAAWGLAVYDGGEGYAAYLAIRAGEVTEAEALFVQCGWLLTFGERGDLEPDDLAIVRMLALEFRGRRAWPRFRSLSPGYLPWFLTARECRRFALTLDQAREVAAHAAGRRLAADPDGRLLVRVPRPVSGGWSWEDRRVSPELPALAPRPAPVDELRPRRLRTALRAASTAWELGYFYSPVVLRDTGGRPCFGTVLLVVDHATGSALDAHIGRPALCAASLQTEFLDMIERIGRRPSAVLVTAALEREALDPLARPLAFGLQHVADLPHLAAARRALTTHLTSRLPHH